MKKKLEKASASSDVQIDQTRKTEYTKLRGSLEKERIVLANAKIQIEMLEGQKR